MPARDRNESNILRIVSNLLDEVGCLLDNFFISGFGPLGGIHLVDGNNKLLDTQSVSQESVLTSLTILGDTSLELAYTSSNDN